MHWGEVAFFSAVIVSFLAGTAAFRILDQRGNRRRVVQIMAVGMFGLCTSTDLCLLCVASHWPILLLNMGFGAVNALSSERTGAITCMVTGHVQRLAGFVADFASNSSRGGISDKARRGAGQSLRIFSMFCFGVAAGSIAT